MRHFYRALGIALLTLSLAPSSRGGDVTVGNISSGESNFIPFGGAYANNDGGTEYQQVYLGSLFGTSPFLIGSVTFYAAPSTAPALNADGTYTLSLSTTTAPVGGLSTNFASNVGPDSYTFFSGTLPPSVSTTMTFTLPTAFDFNPTAGNLLLDVTFTGVTNKSDAYYIAQNDDFGMLSSRMVNGSAGGTTGYGLVTTFGGAGTPTIVPEPSSLGLGFAAVGSLAFAGFFWRRRRAEV